MDYSGWSIDNRATHPHDDGVTLGGYGAIATGGYDAVVSLCRTGRADLGVEHVNVWLVDDTAAGQPEPGVRARGHRGAVAAVAVRAQAGAAALRRGQQPDAERGRPLLGAARPGSERGAGARMPWAEPQGWLWNAAVGAED